MSFYLMAYLRNLKASFEPLKNAHRVENSSHWGLFFSQPHFLKHRQFCTKSTLKVYFSSLFKKELNYVYN